MVFVSVVSVGCEVVHGAKGKILFKNMATRDDSMCIFASAPRETVLSIGYELYIDDLTTLDMLLL